jgi:predicted sulfurtransferase
MNVPLADRLNVVHPKGGGTVLDSSNSVAESESEGESFNFDSRVHVEEDRS